MKLVALIPGIAFLIVSPMAAVPEQKAQLTLERIFKGNLQQPAPTEVRWAPDGRRLGYFLPKENGEREFWVLDVQTGEKNCIVASDQAREMAPSPGQASIGERERTRRIRYGKPSYVWTPDGTRILFISAGHLYLYDLSDHRAHRLAPSKKDLRDPRISPDGKWIAFIYEYDIWVVPTSGGKERRLTFGGSRSLLHGEPDWIYLEELDMRTGYSWSPDSRSIAFIELDEKSVPLYPLIEQSVTSPTVDFQFYPKAGDPNPAARVGVVSLKSGKITWMKQTAEYIPRMEWADSNAVVLQLLNRAQNELELIEVNPVNGRSRILLREKDAHWLDVTDNLAFLSGGREFLWTSNRSGFHHIYLYSRGGQLIRPVTSGEWVVQDIIGVDERNGWIYYSSNQSEPIGLNLFRIRMDGTGAERVTREPGTHAVFMNASNTALVDFHSSLKRAQQITVQDLTGGKKIELHTPRDLGEFELAEPEIREVKAPDGAVVRVLLYKPRRMESGRKYPMVVYAYGMPGVPSIKDSWEGNRGLFHQFLVQQGFLVAQIDDRSSAIPGHKYAVSAYGRLGALAAQDHEVALRELQSLPFVDAESIAFWGWSGGGFLAAYHMTHTRLFTAAVAVAPVMDWRLYDSIYTERYMGMPDQAPEAYDRASAVKAAADLQGRLLLVHGTLDDNVHLQNTIQMVDALVAHNKQFDLMLYPDKTHSIYGAADSLHLYTTLYQFLTRTLKE
jgi:dipeptidyl-peptidase-4